MKCITWPTGLIAVFAAALIVSGGAYARSIIGDPPETGYDQDQQLELGRELVERDDSDYPDVVAEVGEREISGVRLNQRVQMTKANAEVTGQDVPGDFESVALQSLITEEVLLQYADDHDILVTRDEAAETARQEYQMLADQDSPSAQEALAILAEQHGIDPEDYPTDPAVIDSYQELETIQKARVHILESRDVSEIDSPDEADEAMADALAPYREEVRIFIDTE
jgi:hypothetical protein